MHALIQNVVRTRLAAEQSELMLQMHVEAHNQFSEEADKVSLALENAVLIQAGRTAPPAEGEPPVRVSYNNVLISILPGEERPYFAMEELSKTIVEQGTCS